MGCSVTTKKILVFGIGSFLLVVGAFLGGFTTMIVESILNSKLVLDYGSTSYNNWIELPIPMYMEFYLFNVSNAEEFERNNSVLPQLQEVGPYVYREYHTRNIMAWNDDNDTITFQTKRTWYFDEDLSVGSEDDIVTTINLIAATVNYFARSMNPLMKMIVNSMLTSTDEHMTVTTSVRELLFDGYNDTLLEFAKGLFPNISIPFDKFAYFVNRNESASYDGVYNMYTGASDLDLLGTVATWKYMNETPYFDPPCNKISGTTGELWAPIKDKGDVKIFAPDVCATMKMTYRGRAELNGVDGYEYLLSDNAFDTNDDSVEECFCLNGTDCAPQGLMDSSACHFSAPAYVSRPHFMDADVTVQSRVGGLTPDPEKHSFTLGLEPFTGMPLYVNARLMLSVLLEPVERIKLYENLPHSIYFPAFWFNQKAMLSEDLAYLAKIVKMSPAIGMGVFFGLAGVGFVMIATGIILSACNRWGGRIKTV